MLKNFTVIEGNIGSGKTTLSKMISAGYKANLILEEFEENPFLTDFLADQKVNPLGVELQFLIDRFHQLKQHINNNQPTVADYFIEKSLIFSSNNLSKIEKTLFDSYYNILFEKATSPDILFYLSVNEDRLIHNIKKRGRGNEKELTKGYLKSIHDSYITYIKNKTKQKTVIIDVSDIDFVENSNEYEYLKEIIIGNHKEHLSQIKL